MSSIGKKQKERKLLFQVGIVIGLIFFSVILTVTIIMYRSTMKGYLEAQEVERYTGEVAKLSAENERIATELSLAAQIQEGQLSTEFPHNSRYQLCASMAPAKEVGGDFYDFS